MEVRCNMSLRMTLVVLSFLLMVQLPNLFASGLLIKSKACGTDHISYSSDSRHDFLYINGRLVDKDLFCEVLKFHFASNCFIPEDDRNRFCGLNLSLDELPSKSVRKFLHKLDSRAHGRRNLQTSQPNHDKDAQKSLLTPKKLAVAVPGFFAVCCVFLCPCFYARRKQASHAVLSKDPTSMDSASSLEMNSVHEKNPGSPFRDKIPGSPFRDKIPGSPFREKIPGSPLRVPPSPSRFSMSPKLNRVGSIHLNMTQVARATQNFSKSLQLGEGGFGTVYKAQLPDGQIVAIKRAKKDLNAQKQSGNSYNCVKINLSLSKAVKELAAANLNLEGNTNFSEYFESLKTEFSSEVELLAKIDHRNLVKLLGYLEKGNERLIITEYVANGTLREHLDGLKGKILDFNQRLEISIDIAHALTYLHLYSEKQIIHRDVKSSNILLTESMRAKVADFGFARLGTMDSEKTHVSTKVKGTVGYLDPEYMRTYQLTPKSDVYSFGVLLIEILTGRRPVELKKPADERVTLRWAFRSFSEGNVRGMVDPLMEEALDQDILSKMFELAFECAAPTRVDRPDMKSVGEQLWAIRMDYLRSGRRG